MSAPIGIFDSGYGGLTILKEIQQEMPEYDFLYLGDNARTPYGNRSFDVVYQYTLEAVKHLFDNGCELVILACNTASAKALRSIQQNDLPQIDPDKRVLGVIRPSTELVGNLSKSKHIGILGTTGTVNSESYPIEIKKSSPEVVVNQLACPMWVPLVENRTFNSPGGSYFIKESVDEIMAMDPKIDVLVLACTHYPLLLDQIKKHVPDHVNVLAQGSLVAISLKDYLLRHPEMDVKCSKNGTLRFHTTERTEVFDENAGFFMGHDVKSEQVKL